MTSGGNNLNDFPELTYQMCSLNSIKENRDHAFFCSKQEWAADRGWGGEGVRTPSVLL